MAIKTVKKGSDTFKATCHRCGCRFTYELSDLNRRFGVGVEEVLCPTCGESVSHFVWSDAARGSK